MGGSYPNVAITVTSSVGLSCPFVSAPVHPWNV
jgi:hypothetical protein